MNATRTRASRLARLTALILATMTSLPLLLHAAPQPALAQGTSSDLDLERSGSISVSVQTADEVAAAGAQLELFEVAEPVVRDAALVFEALPSFAGSGADLSSPGSDTLPADLAAWADAQAVPALAQTVTDGQGEAVFSQLVCGLYLVRQAGGAEGFTSIDPFVVCLPMTSADGTSWVYDVTASPKVAEQPVVPQEPEDPQGPGDTKLPQTGQLNWPVPVLVVLGLALFSLGWGLRFGRRKDSHEK